MELVRRLAERYHIEAVPPSVVSRSCALGIYLAFSPFLGIQTILVFIFSFLFHARSSIVLAILYLVNNPWTMFPIFFLEYGLGVWILQLLHIDWVLYEPAWMVQVSDFLVRHALHYVGIDRIGILPYLLGGHLVAIPAAMITFFFCQRWYRLRRPAV